MDPIWMRAMWIRWNPIKRGPTYSIRSTWEEMWHATQQQRTLSFPVILNCIRVPISYPGSFRWSQRRIRNFYHNVVSFRFRFTKWPRLKKFPTTRNNWQRCWDKAKRFDSMLISAARVIPCPSKKVGKMNQSRQVRETFQFWVGWISHDFLFAEMRIFTETKRQGSFFHWEPTFIGTRDDPYYDERLPWEGSYDKMPQAYILCLMDYTMSLLSDAFLVHRPGIKKQRNKSNRHAELENRTKKFIYGMIAKEIHQIYGHRKNCEL